MPQDAVALASAGRTPAHRSSAAASLALRCIRTACAVSGGLLTLTKTPEAAHAEAPCLAGLEAQPSEAWQQWGDGFCSWKRTCPPPALPAAFKTCLVSLVGSCSFPARSWVVKRWCLICSQVILQCLEEPLYLYPDTQAVLLWKTW